MSVPLIEICPSLFVVADADAAGVVTGAVSRMFDGHAEASCDIYILTTTRGADAIERELLSDRPRAARGRSRARRAIPRFGGALLSRRHITLLQDAEGALLPHVGAASDLWAIGDQFAEWLTRLAAAGVKPAVAAVSRHEPLIGMLVTAVLPYRATSETRLWSIDLGPEPTASATRVGSKRKPAERLNVTADAHPVGSMVEIPFGVVSATRDASEPMAFSGLVRQQRLERRYQDRPPEAVMHSQSRCLRVGELSARLTRTQTFWYVALLSLRSGRLDPSRIGDLLERGTEGRTRLRPGAAADGPQTVQTIHELCVLARRVLPNEDLFLDHLRRACGSPEPGLRSIVAKINRTLRAALGSAAGPYLIQGGRGTCGYRAPSAAVRVVGLDRAPPAAGEPRLNGVERTRLIASLPAT